MKENQHLEWKETWRDEFLRWICGFANAEGGILHIGRNDKGVVVGLPDAAKLLEDIPNKVRDVLGILVAVNAHEESGRPWLEIVVAAYPNPISYRGHYFQRSGSTLQEMKGAALDRFLLRRQGRTWDGVPMPGVNEWITYQGIQRIERYPVPDAALREAVLNALVHRDYAVPAPIQIRVYEDHLSIWNPCVLPDNWTLKNLLGTHPSTPFNPAIANVFFRSGEIETWGRGIQRIFAACLDEGTPKPRLRFESNGLWIHFPFATEYLAALQKPESLADPVTAQVTEQVGQRLESELESRLESGVESGVESPMVTQILSFLANDALGKAAIAWKLRKTKPTRYLNDLMAKLTRATLIERTLPGKPNSRLQKYRLTARGRAWLAQHPTSAS